MRYTKLPQQQIINTYTPPNVEFYAGILNRAQQNLDNAELTKAKYMEDLYNIRSYDEAAKNMVIKQAEESISNSMNRAFVSSSDVAKAVTKASKFAAPFRNLNALQLEKAALEQQERARLGAGYIGNSVTNMSLIDPATGNWISPNKINLIYGDMDEFTKKFLTETANERDMERYVAGDKWITTANGQLLQRTDTKVKGLTQQEVAAKYLNNDNVINNYMNSMPGLTQAIAASGQDPKEWYRTNINKLSQGLIGGAMQIPHTERNEEYMNPSQRLDAAYKQAQIDALNNKGNGNGIPLTTGTGSGNIKTPMKINNVNSMLTSLIGGHKTNFDNVKFGPDGNVMEKHIIPARDEFNQVSEQMVHYNEQISNNPNYGQEKLDFEKARLYLMRQATNTGEINKIKSMSHKDIYNLFNNASNKAVTNYVNPVLNINDGISFRNISPFVDADGKFVPPNSDIGLEIYDKRAKQWVTKTYDELMATWTKPENKAKIREELAKMSTRTLDLSGNPGTVKIPGEIILPDGDNLLIRYNPPNIVINNAYKPLQELQQAGQTPGKKNVVVNGVVYELNTKFDITQDNPQLVTTVGLIQQPDPYTLNILQNSEDPYAALMGIANEVANQHLISRNAAYLNQTQKKGAIE